MFTCLIRYVVDLNKIRQFKEYANIWIRLVEKYGGIHHGYFLPIEDGNKMPNPSLSFPDIAKSGPGNIAIAIFSFENLEKYEAYKKEVQNDEECKYITKRFQENQCFLSYERSFLKPLFFR